MCMNAVISPALYIIMCYSNLHAVYTSSVYAVYLIHIVLTRVDTNTTKELTTW